MNKSGRIGKVKQNDETNGLTSAVEEKDSGMYEASGTIKLINDIQSFASGFTKREFVVTTGDKYPQDLKFEVVKDKCSMLDTFAWLFYL